ncbi:hypothetical protein QFW77_09765 [Luteimonas sp. RD2P54]|uniref:Peptidase C-terminal archaeal/bacterial domain-containing protein n=1 Tax=Luteimonas endophytica TaxID=3042023 RepID=A0ABT6J8Y7_9GAMM|nr:hypothetical protein [Luteimonas endophytica]MDH5823269.1 hypothetical protein [Luteimonas endophytica]
MKRHVSCGIAAAAMLCLAGAGQARDYAGFTLGAGFTPDPQTATGLTGGNLQASRYGSQCSGMIDTTPDHVIDVTSTLDLQLAVDSTTDSTLVLTGPAGTFCDDDSGGLLDAQLTARLTPGRYEVYVGHLGSAGSYTLTLSEALGGAGSDSAGLGGLYRDFSLGAGFTPDPQRGSGSTGGPREASSVYGAQCSGMIDTSPDHRLEVTSKVALRLSVESTTDATLVLVGQGGTWCDDDSRGALDPELSAVLMPGNYEIYVGHISDSGSYTLSLTEAR